MLLNDKKIPQDAILRAMQVGQRAFLKTLDDVLAKTGFDIEENAEMRKTFLAAYSTGFLEGCDLLLQIMKGNAATIVESDETIN